MSALTSLLVRDQVVPVRKIEEALQRQVISGGELETVLLEVGAVAEDVLSAYRAASFGLLPARRDDVMRAPEEVVRLVSREIAQKYQVMPYAIEGTTLLLAMSAPLTPDVVRELSRQFGMEVDSRIVNEVRVSAALADHYGVAPIPRMQRLAEKLLGQTPGDIPFVAPPSTRPPRPSQQPAPISLGTPFVKPSDVVTTRQSNRPPSAGGMQQPQMPANSLLPEAARPTVAVSAATQAELQQALLAAQNSLNAPAPSLRPRNSFVSLPIDSIRPSGVLRRLRGPMGVELAFELLQQTTTRDEILAVFFAFARQYFDYAALFVATDEAAEGRDAHGPGASQHDVQRISVSFRGENAFADVRTKGVGRLAILNALPEDQELAQKLQRPNDIVSAVIPLAIRKRVVLLFYGDRSGETFQLDDVRDVLAVAPKVGEAFERLIRERKAQAQLVATTDVAHTPMVAAPSASQLPASPTPSALRPASVPPVPLASNSIPASSRVVSVAPASATVRPSSDWEGLKTSVDAATPKPFSIPPAPASPGIALIPAREKRASSGALSVLSVPRSAPPPPSPQRAPASVPPAAGIASERAPENPPLTASLAPGKQVPLPSTPPPVNLSARPPVDGSYSSTEARVDVIRALRASSQPPARNASSAPPVAAPSSIPPGRSVIVDMGDQVEELVRILASGTSPDEDSIIDTLVGMGEAALPSLVQRFPGILRFNRNEPHTRLPRGRDVSALAKAIASFRGVAVPYMSTILEAIDADTRFYATLLCSEIVEEALIDKLKPRLFDMDVGVRSLAIDVLRLFQRFPTYHRVTDTLRSAARIPGKDPHVRLVGTRALGELRDVGSVSLLIALLDEQDRALVAEAERSLSLITRQTLGDSRRKWDAWAERNLTRHRIEWLIDGLMHSEESVRSAAGDELKRITQEYYGYHPSAAKKDRERVQRRYQTWWETEGNKRFT